MSPEENDVFTVSIKFSRDELEHTLAGPEAVIDVRLAELKRMIMAELRKKRTKEET